MNDFKLIKKYKTAINLIKANGYKVDESGLSFGIHKDIPLYHGEALFRFESIDELYGFSCALSHCKKDSIHRDIN